MIRVVVISIHRTPSLIWWYVKRYERGNTFMGWARDNATFTAGTNATAELGEATVFLDSASAASWANECGWHVEAVMTNQ